MLLLLLPRRESGINTKERRIQAGMNDITWKKMTPPKRVNEEHEPAGVGARPARRRRVAGCVAGRRRPVYKLVDDQP
ncbi:hypothetical protein WMF04_01370 [Sorangium sp. So ce260]|uniref:hypothetical protein n=1 Tax=Sorangium sp. So ce260 TaxID=3133291 RepID=UPI003F62D569